MCKEPDFVAGRQRDLLAARARRLREKRWSSGYLTPDEKQEFRRLLIDVTGSTDWYDTDIQRLRELAQVTNRIGADPDARQEAMREERLIEQRFDRMLFPDAWAVIDRTGVTDVRTVPRFRVIDMVNGQPVIRVAYALRHTCRPATEASTRDDPIGVRHARLEDDGSVTVVGAARDLRYKSIAAYARAVKRGLPLDASAKGRNK